MSYLREIFALTMFSVILEALSPDGGSCKKQLKQITSLLLLIAIISPLSGFVKLITELPSAGDISSGDEPDAGRDEFDMLFISETKLAIEDNVKKLLSSRYSIPLDAIKADCELDASDISNVTLIKMEITFTAVSLPINTEAIAEYISSQLGCPCSIEQK